MKKSLADIVHESLSPNERRVLKQMIAAYNVESFEMTRYQSQEAVSLRAKLLGAASGSGDAR